MTSSDTSLADSLEEKSSQNPSEDSSSIDSLEESQNGATDSLVAVLAVIIPVLAIIFWLSGLPVS